MKRKQLSLAVLAALAGLPAGAWAQDSGNPGVATGPEPQVEEVYVLGKFVPDEKRDTSEISNVLGQEDMNLVPETDVGATLSRVAGLSLVGGKYVYVRGLGERYSSTLINLSRISSPVPFQKTVPLDIVPNNIVKSLLVQKTYSVQYPGDFSGGLVDIRTKTLPDEDYLSMKLNVGGNSKTTDGDGIYYKGGKRGHDNWGLDDGTRAIPRNVQKLTPEEFEATPYPDKANLGASFYDKWDIYQKDMKPIYDGEVELGKRFDFDNGMALGIISNYKYTNAWINTIKDLRRYEFTGVGGEARQTLDYTRFLTTQTINKSAFGNIGFEFNQDHSITFNAIDLQQTVDETQQDRGISSEDNIENGVPVENYLLQWTENRIQMFQLSGQDFFPSLNDLSISWRASDGSGRRNSPDTRTFTYAEDFSGTLAMVDQSRQAAGDLRDVYQSPDRDYSSLDDSINEYGIDLELPVDFLDTTLRAGWSDYKRERDSKDRIFRFGLAPSAPEYVAWETPNQFFGNPNWADLYLTVRDFTSGQANASQIYPYARSSESVDAFYASFDSQILPTVRFQLGVRVEDTQLDSDAWGGNTEKGTDNKVSRSYNDTFPAGSVTWEFIENMQLRLAYSQTVNRPSLLEITGSTLRNPADQNLYRGNVYLEPADVDNYDARWEWYFGSADEMSLGYFHKDFDNPIELGKIQAQGDIYTWFNADSAELDGVEYDVRKDLSFGTWFDLDPMWDNFRIAANVSWIDSQVTLLGNNQTAADVPLTGGRQLAQLYSDQRKMTGQSDWLGNIQLTYEDVNTGITANLLYNYTGERIILVGDNNAPDIVEEDRQTVDVLCKYQFDWHSSQLEVEAKAANILNTKIEWTQGNKPYENWQPGITYSVGLKATF